MADMTLCSGSGCADRDNCKRYTTPAVPLQSWGEFEAWMGDRCAFYMPVRDAAAWADKQSKARRSA